MPYECVRQLPKINKNMIEKDKKINKKLNVLKALKIKVMTFSDDKKASNKFAKQLNDYLLDKIKRKEI
ncbi:MAG: hypothetical protein O3A39_06795 [Proteobacteria bacterium]|nr:hypothetical protein [Pseudomonadota bacterium]